MFKIEENIFCFDYVKKNIYILFSKQISHREKRIQYLIKIRR